MNASLRHPASVGAAPKNAVPTRSAIPRRMLQSQQLEFLMEAHNGLSARIVREAGFGGIHAAIPADQSSVVLRAYRLPACFARLLG